jgi:hypothetical protein
LKNWNISYLPPAGFFIEGEMTACLIFLESLQITLLKWVLLLCAMCKKKLFLGIPPNPLPPYLQLAMDLLSVKQEPRQNVNVEK